jgi:hypothetical protein
LGSRKVQHNGTLLFSSCEYVPLFSEKTPANRVKNRGLSLSGLSLDEVETRGKGKGLVAVAAKVG